MKYQIYTNWREDSRWDQPDVVKQDWPSGPSEVWRVR